MIRFIRAIVKWFNSPKGTAFVVEPSKKKLKRLEAEEANMKRLRKLNGKPLPKLDIEKDGMKFEEVGEPKPVRRKKK